MNGATHTFPLGHFVEYENHRLYAEASTLLLPPGQWPNAFTVEPRIGNGRLFRLTSLDDGSANYMQELGCITIKIWND
jgi:hypothetical protein